MATIGVRASTPGAVTAEMTELGGRAVALVRIDPGTGRHGMTIDGAGTLAVAARMAVSEGRPLVVDIRAGPADERAGIEALAGWGRSARALVGCSGVVPVIGVLSGSFVAGPALLLGVVDHVVMTEQAGAHVNGPRAVAEFTGIATDADELGGAGTHARHTGIAALTAADHDGALDAVGRLLAYLPDSADALPAPWPSDDPVDRATPEAGAVLPATATGSYDVRDVMRAVADDGELLEVRARWAPNLVTAYATIAGRPVGMLGNQPLAIAGTLDIPASQKGARFVTACDAFNLPLVTLVDTPGFYPGKDLEWRGMIRHGAQLVFAYGQATVPRVCVILRKSYGGAYIVMDSKTMGNDLCLAWPSAELAVMGARGAVEILHRRATPEERRTREQDYEARLLNPYVAAERGYVDAVIEPADTRRVIGHALAAFDAKRERLPGRKHDNGPL